MCGALPTEVEHRGVNGEAMMLLGPSADPEAWRNRAMSAMRGRVDAGYLDDCRDEAHPLWVLGTWEQLWRDHLDQPSDLRQTIGRAGDYLERQMHRMAEEDEVPFDDFAGDVRRCRSHLEDVLRDGVKPERGAPCVQCGRSMERVEDDETGAQDAYRCRRCHRTVSGDQYRYAVGVAYRAHADYLTLDDCAERTDVNRSTIKVWANRGHIRKRKDHGSGRMTYNVLDVQERHAREPESA
jgi:hypothetical protein